MSYPLFFHSLSPSALAVCTHPPCGPFWDSTNTEHRGAEERGHINGAGKANAREGKTWMEGVRRVWGLTPLRAVAGGRGGGGMAMGVEAGGRWRGEPQVFPEPVPVWLWRAVKDRARRWAVHLLCSVKDAPCSFLSPNCPGRLEIRGGSSHQAFVKPAGFTLPSREDLALLSGNAAPCLWMLMAQELDANQRESPRAEQLSHLCTYTCWLFRGS